MTEEEFKTRFDLTCFSVLIGVTVLGALFFKGCQYGAQKMAQFTQKQPVAKQVASAPQTRMPTRIVHKAQKAL